jgi:glucokinase
VLCGDRFQPHRPASRPAHRAHIAGLIVPRGNALGIDVGGTNIKWVVVGESSEVKMTGSFATPRVDEMAIVDALADLVATMRREGRDVARIGLAIPGHIDRDAQATTVVPNLPGDWNGFPLGDEITARTGIRPAIMNDARAFAAAELGLACAGGLEQAVFVTVGTGIGGAAALNSAILRGPRDSVGELGHITVRADGPVCGCGNRGCAEAFAGGASIVARAREAAVAVGATRDHPGGSGNRPGIRSPEDVRDAACGGDALARQILAEAYWALGSAVTSACVFLGVRTVIVGGGLGRRWPGYRAEIERQLGARIGLLGPAQVLTSTFGDEGGAVGAALFASTPKPAQGKAT